MSKKILKYTIGSEDCNVNLVGRNQPFSFFMVKGAQILDLKVQKIVPSEYMIGALGRIFVLVNASETEKEERKFVLYETGQNIDTDNKKYIGSYLVLDDKIELHLFEILNQ